MRAEERIRSADDNDENRSCKNSQESGHARKTVLAEFNQKKSSAATWTMKQTRDTDMLVYGRRE